MVSHLSAFTLDDFSKAFTGAFSPGEHTDVVRAADRGELADPVPKAEGFCVSKQVGSSPPTSVRHIPGAGLL